MNCPLCKNNSLERLYFVENLPIFQNKSYSSLLEARNVKKANVELVRCDSCDYIFNVQFESQIMDYDENYQNEQANSLYFQDYLDKIIRIFEIHGFKNKKIVEIGCGKAFFLKKLWENEFNAVGFDPAYEGDDPRIVKDYYSSKYPEIQADLIILRHTLEHIANPDIFLQSIADATNSLTQIYIEVPSFEWILKRKAFWDIFYEHCNYFTEQRLKSFFDDSEHGLLFNEQYQYVIASLDKLNIAVLNTGTPEDDTGSLDVWITKYKTFVNEHPNLIIWGAGAKGSTFVNLIDPEYKYISCVVDINSKKQGKFIAGSGHRIISPSELNNIDCNDILIMNENYVDEIKNIINTDKFNIFFQGDDNG